MRNLLTMVELSSHTTSMLLEIIAVVIMIAILSFIVVKVVNGIKTNSAWAQYLNGVSEHLNGERTELKGITASHRIDVDRLHAREEAIDLKAKQLRLDSNDINDKISHLKDITNLSTAAAKEQKLSLSRLTQARELYEKAITKLEAKEDEVNTMITEMNNSYAAYERGSADYQQGLKLGYMLRLRTDGNKAETNHLLEATCKLMEDHKEDFDTIIADMIAAATPDVDEANAIKAKTIETNTCKISAHDGQPEAKDECELSAKLVNMPILTSKRTPRKKK